jgi:hypothetical protein
LPASSIQKALNLGAARGGTARRSTKSSPIRPNKRRSREAKNTGFFLTQRIDECQDWADRAAALASYAKQATDDSLHRMATRIQLRAVRRCGELMQKIPAAKNQHDGACMGAHTSRSQAARDAGLSGNQKHTALRVASVPEAEFEAALESDDCPTVTEMAERGTAKREPTFEETAREMVGDRDPKEFRAATHAQGELCVLAQWTQTVTPEAIVRGSCPPELPALARHASAFKSWLEKLITLIEKELKDDPGKANPTRGN